MRRQIVGVLSVLALVLCTGRVAAWASPNSSPHACCQPQKGTPAAPTLSDCCPTAAVSAAPQIFFSEIAIIGAAPSIVVGAGQFFAFAPEVNAPPGLPSYWSAPPARAPPLA